ncbi:RNA-guided endonuclease TnpB family protein [Nocardia sp. XZ_19_385]|uniref:RNA-guided endonuclease InsQ/TnpB family protein n=1 Tax=Nocardia sp. XZ_19_385 TaxID=2769488 RepID=UPI00188FAC00
MAFRYCLDPTVEQRKSMSRHAGAARFAYNHSLATVKAALDARKIDPTARVPWTRFDLINEFNNWKRSAEAGRVFIVDPAGTAAVVAVGLVWRHEVSAQVFEEAAVDLGRGLAGWSDARTGKRAGRAVGFPQFKKKAVSAPSFRFRNKHVPAKRPPIRVGDRGIPRSIRLPGIGRIRVRENTRSLRRLLRKDRARILSATVSEQGGRWWVSLACESSDLHPARRHPVRDDSDNTGWVGVDRGLSALLVAASSDGTEVARVTETPRPLSTGMRVQRRRARDVTRKQKGSARRARAIARLARHHHRVRNIRTHFLHQVSNALVNTHDRLVLENLNIAGMARNHHLARAISDAGWGEFARQVTYKQQWRGGQIATADRWFASSRRCSACGDINEKLTLADRVYSCRCGHRLDRDLNAAVNLAAWGERHHRIQVREPEARAPVKNVRGQDGSGPHTDVGETSLVEAETDTHSAPAGRAEDVREGRCLRTLRCSHDMLPGGDGTLLPRTERKTGGTW